MLHAQVPCGTLDMVIVEPSNVPPTGSMWETGHGHCETI